MLVNTEVESVHASGVTLKNGQTLASQTVIWTVGVQASALTAQIDAPRDRQGRLQVNTELQVPGYEDIYATGDIACAATDDKGHYALMTCQHAILLGKFAGNNAAASLLHVAPCLIVRKSMLPVWIWEPGAQSIPKGGISR
ncbi:oxidoreductase [Salmonella bongori]|nr:oxidoreductase [Salmonella bongori]